MKALIIIIQLALFFGGSSMIILDYKENGPDPTIVGWTGAIFCFIAVILLYPLATLISKEAKNKRK